MFLLRRPAASKASWRSAMVDDAYAKFRNDDAVPEIRIGIKEFKCIGVSPPHDHPYIYLDMGSDDTIRCPYCATCSASTRVRVQVGPSRPTVCSLMNSESNETSPMPSGRTPPSNYASPTTAL
jgi:uncharacterized Zn-finger protein